MITYFFNRMIGYNTVFYDNETDDQYYDEVDQKAVKCYIKFGKKYFEYIQPIRLDNDDNIVTKENEIIIPRAKFIPIATVLQGIVIYIIPLYIYM